VSDTFPRARRTTKPPVPKATDRPLMGLCSSKNFIAANAIENILAKPPTKTKPQKATDKKDYGRVPTYLLTIKQQIEFEKQKALREYERSLGENSGLNGSSQTHQTRPMSTDDRDELLYSLKMKWQKLNHAYAGLSFSLDVPSHKRRKEDLEREMTQLEKDIKSLQGKQVVVMEDCWGGVRCAGERVRSVRGVIHEANLSSRRLSSRPSLCTNPALNYFNL
jgi:hypothetical protein